MEASVRDPNTAGVPAAGLTKAPRETSEAELRAQDAHGFNSQWLEQLAAEASDLEVEIHALDETRYQRQVRLDAVRSAINALESGAKADRPAASV